MAHGQHSQFNIQHCNNKMNSNQNIQPVNKLVKSQEKMAKLEIQIFKLRLQLHQKMKKHNKEKVKYEAIQESQRRRETKKVEKAAQKAAKVEAKIIEKAARKAEKVIEKAARKAERKAARKAANDEEKAAQKAAEKTEKVIQLQAKREIKNYWSTAEQVEGMAELHNDCLIRMANSSDPETGLSLENLFRIVGHRLQTHYPNGWEISTFKSTFRSEFGSLTWMKEMNNQENSISSVFYRMCPESETSASKITGKLRAIPSFMKAEGGKAKYKFDANLYLYYC